MRIMRVFLFIFCCVWSAPAQGSEIDSVLVNKSEEKMYLLSQGEKVKEYSIVLGWNPKGHKREQGDGRTPEGKYLLDYKKDDSSFYKAIHISYPNAEDRAWARERGVDPGGLIMIHGRKNGLNKAQREAKRFDWTNGCIEVTNKEMDEIWDLVEVGTPIEIKP
jgi:murein L,D-transpeptidase YafK